MNNSRPNPYVGPRAFMTGEKLYGRDRELRELMDLLIAERIVLLYSPSGAGKSSLIYAGLLPGLAEEKFNILPVVRVNKDPGSLNGSNHYMNSVLFSLDSALPPEQRTPPEKLFGMSLENYLVSRPRPENAPSSDVIVFDQFEEVLTVQPTDREAKAAFFTQVGAALRDRKRWALFAMREDYLAQLDPYLRPIPTRLSNRYRLDLLGTQSAMEAIQNPVRAAGVEFTDNAALKLVDDLRCIQVQQPDGSVEKQPGLYVEPVQLQVVCYRLWENLGSGDLDVSPEDIAAVGNVDQSLANYYAQSVQQASRELGVAERHVREWFEERLITEGGLRSQVLRGSNQGLPEAVIQRLGNTHLVRAEKRAGSTWYELAHDRLIGPIRADNAAWMQVNLNLLQRQAKLWNRQDRAASLLLRGDELVEAMKWQAEHPGEMSPLEVLYLRTSQDAAQREQEVHQLSEQKLRTESAEKLAEAEKRRATEQAKAATRLRRRAFILTIALLALIAAAGVAVFFARQASTSATTAINARETSAINEQAAISQQAAAETQRAIAVAASTQSEANAQEARSLLSTAQAASTQAIAQQQTAVAANQNLVSLSALTMQEGGSDLAVQQASETLSHSLSSLVYDTAPSDPQLALLLAIEAFNASATSEAQAALDYALAQVEFKFLSEPDLLFDYSNPFSIVAVSPDGRYVAWGTSAGGVSIWSLDERQEIYSLGAQSRAEITALAFSPDGTLLAGGDRTGQINLWYMENGHFGYFLESEAVVTSLAFTPDNTILASAGLGDNIYLWRVDRSTGPSTLSSRSRRTMTSLAWSPDGTRLASGDTGGTIWLWDAASRQYSLELGGGHSTRVSALAWSPDGTILASASQDVDTTKNLFVWDFNNGTGQALVSPQVGITALGFTPDGQTLFSGSRDSSLVAWATATLEPLSQPVLLSGGVPVGLLVDPNSSFVVTADHNGNVEVRSMVVGSPVDQACQVVSRNMSSLEWSQYFQYQPYRTTCPNAPGG